MNEEAVVAAARAIGIAVDWIDATGQPRRVRPQSLRRLVEALGGPPAEAPPLPPLVVARVGRPLRLPGLDDDAAAELEFEDGERRALRLRAGLLPRLSRPGYHRLRLANRETVIAASPGRCRTLAEVGAGRRLWGVSAQVYALRRPGDGGIGDAGGVRDLAVAAARHGADAVALSPVHSLFVHQPGRAGPYAPSSRLFLNPLYADPAATFDAAALEPADAVENDTLIDWQRAGTEKLARLRRLFDRFVEKDTPLVRAFEAYLRQGGEALARHARFEAGFGGPERYHLFLQWITARSFAAAQQAARQAGMRIGLVSDLAIGMDRAGSHAASRGDDLLMDLSIGAPPDLFNPHGQDWGITGFSPRALRDGGYEPFLATVRAALAHAGGLRIDHVMGLVRLWLIPQGQPPSEGAYLSYPVEDLLALLALESHRHRAVVIGEDLGTVPPGFRARLRRAGIAGMDVLWFERTGRGFRPPARWRPDAVAMTTTHDLPTVAGWWSGEDIRTRRGLGLAAPGEETARAADRQRLWRAFGHAGLGGEAPPADLPDAAVDAALSFVARSPASLMLAPLEDLLGQVAQPNLPGTVDEHPNWRRRHEPPAATLFEAPAVRRRVEAIARARRGEAS